MRCVLKIKLFEDTESRHDFSTQHSQPAATSMTVARGRRRSYFILHYHTHIGIPNGRVKRDRVKYEYLPAFRSSSGRTLVRDETKKSTQPSGRSNGRKSGPTFRFAVINQYEPCKRGTRLPIVVTPQGGRTWFITVSTGRFPRKSRRYVQFGRVRRARISQHLPSTPIFFSLSNFPRSVVWPLAFKNVYLYTPNSWKREHIITRCARPRRV